MKINIRFESDNRKMQVMIDDNSKVINLKKLIMDKTNIPIKRQKLTFKGNIMDDDKYISGFDFDFLSEIKLKIIMGAFGFQKKPPIDINTFIIDNIYDFLSDIIVFIWGNSIYTNRNLIEYKTDKYPLHHDTFRQQLPIPILEKAYLENKDCTLIGPNCPGVITPDEAKVGIMPGFIFKKGNVGIVSKSGTLTYEAADQVVKQGYGITTAIGIGGDPIIGTTTQQAVELLMNDDETEAIVMIGEIGGQLEAEAAQWIKADGNRKPVVGFIAGQTAPAGRTMGHAGAIVGGDDDTAQAKMKILAENGIHVVESPAKIGEMIASVLK